VAISARNTPLNPAPLTNSCIQSIHQQLSEVMMAVVFVRSYCYYNLWLGRNRLCTHGKCLACHEVFPPNPYFIHSPMVNDAACKSLLTNLNTYLPLMASFSQVRSLNPALNCLPPTMLSSFVRVYGSFWRCSFTI
jgi:hypothetical protein